MQQAFSLGFQPPFTNPLQHGEENEEEHEDEKYSDPHLDDRFVSCLPLSSPFFAYLCAFPSLFYFVNYRVVNYTCIFKYCMNL